MPCRLADQRGLGLISVGREPPGVENNGRIRTRGERRISPESPRMLLATDARWQTWLANCRLLLPEANLAADTVPRFRVMQNCITMNLRKRLA